MRSRRHPASQAIERSAFHRWRPSLVDDSTPQRAIRTLIPVARGSRGSGAGRRPCRRGTCRAGSAAHQPGSEPWAGRPAAPQTRPHPECWPRSPAPTVAARCPHRPGGACTRAWPGRPGLRRSGPPPDRPQAEGVDGDPRPVELTGFAKLIQQRLLEPLEHPGVGPTRQTAASRSSPSRSRTRPPAAAPTGWRSGL
jgi:hypothetical protein